MEQSKGKIGIREYVAIVILVIGVKLSDDTPTIFVETLKSAYWMAPLIIGFVSIIPIYFTTKVITAYKNKNLHDVILHLFGRYIGTFLSSALVLILMLGFIFDSAIYVDIIGTFYFTQTPYLMIYTVMMIVCAYGAKKGLEHIGSVSWLVLFYIKISLLLALVLALRESSFSFVFPIFGPGPWDVIKKSTTHVSMFGEFFFMGLIAPYIVSAKAYKKGTWIAFVVIIIELTIAFLVYLFVFDYEGLKMIDYPYQELIRLIRFGFLTNIETFFFPFWIIASFIRFTAYIYLIALFLGGICNIKSFEYLTPTIATIVVIFGMAPEAPTFTIFKLRELLLNSVSPMFLLLPCLMWILAKLRGDLKHEKTSQNN
ncbi:GerAB/ArcD/ProY family transporter [Bacillus sp. REN16]|uniref:GerAB/ArcD/ProY family transporter n=1 Tax=Bacillus sp. REN16 TaxID=2887296 RepID=UPI001E5E815A|nr:GerAB/ArcD/ProY family transporter [Bacillus sp. REN16]MCC3356636.1 spore germination protein [Bacillus sp. REN16]